MRSLAEDLIDGRANKADKNPTKPQIEAANYKLGKLRIGGQQVRIENPAGSIRSGTDRAGQSWSCLMKHHYGYFPFTLGKDGDPVDVFVRNGLDDKWHGKVFVINQKNDKGGFDEVKTVLGATTKEEARQIYRSNYSPGWDGILSIGEASFDDFRKWLRHGDMRKPFPEKLPLTESLLMGELNEPEILTEGGRRFIMVGGTRGYEFKR